ncbi:MAG: PIN domain-containing protein [Cyanobacteria bacterium P01_F01_bin.33]
MVALINQRDRHHAWVVEQLAGIASPMLTCEAVVSETWFLLQRVQRGREALLQLLDRQQIQVIFDLAAELPTVTALLMRYQSLPTSLADVELVRMAELYPDRAVFTLDSDFHIYRKHRDRAIPLIFPQSED